MPGPLFPIDSILRYTSSVIRSDSALSHNSSEGLFEIYYTVSGRCRYFIDDTSYVLLPGDVVLIPAGVIHRINYGAEEHERLLIECTADFIPEAARESLSAAPRLYRSPALSRDIFTIMKKIEAEYENPDVFSTDVVKTNMHILFYELARGAVGRIADARSAVVKEALSYMKKNYAQDITLSAVAAKYFVSPEHLSRSFKRQTGFGFSEYLSLVRLGHAEELLRAKKGMSISEIAYACGFNDSNYFSDKFKRAYGISPLKYSKTE